jgi:hypothetical protein
MPLSAFSAFLQPSLNSMNLLLSYVALGAGLALSATLLAFAVRILRADKFESRRGADRSRSLKDLILGRARIHDDWIPDARVKGGLIYNKRKKRIEVSGRLSDDSLDRVYRTR